MICSFRKQQKSSRQMKNQQNREAKLNCHGNKATTYTCTIYRVCRGKLSNDVIKAAERVLKANHVNESCSRCWIKNVFSESLWRTWGVRVNCPWNWVCIRKHVSVDISLQWIRKTSGKCFSSCHVTSCLTSYVRRLQNNCITVATSGCACCGIGTRLFSFPVLNRCSRIKVRVWCWFPNGINI